MKRLERDGKFWETSAVKKTLVTRTGLIGAPGTVTKKAFKDTFLPTIAMQKAIAAKEKQGWRAPGLVPDRGARDGALETAIRTNRNDGDSYDVYADWLQAHDNALGEIIALQRRGKAKLADQRITALTLPTDLLRATWRWGLWDSLRLENEADWTDETFDAEGLAKFAFGHTACAALRELRIGVLRWGSNHLDVPVVLAQAAKQPWAASLETLVLGDVDGNVDMAHHVVGVVGKAISKAFPSLTSLTIHSSEQTWHKRPSFGLAGLDLPRLKTLTIETCSMSRARLEEVLAATLPALTKLEVWFGDAEYGASATVNDLQPLLANAVHRGVTDLGLCNFKNEALVAALPTSKIAKRLVRLDLSKGTLDDSAAGVLVAHAAKFPVLKELDVTDNYLTSAALRALKKAFPSVVSKEQREVDPNDEDRRYVSVHE